MEPLSLVFTVLMGTFGLHSLSSAQNSNVHVHPRARPSSCSSGTRSRRCAGLQPCRTRSEPAQKLADVHTHVHTLGSFSLFVICRK